MKQFWAFLRDASNSKFWLVIAALIIAGGMTVTIQIGRPPGPAQDAPPVLEGLPIEDAPPDVNGPEGWSGVESLQITAAWAAAQPAFQLIHPDSGEPVWQDNATARVCQWETQAALIGGELPPNVPQEIGDCTSQGAATAIERMQSGGGIRGPPAEFREVSSMWLYGAGRVWVAQGQFGRGDGCSGAAIAQAARDYGVLPLDTPGLPSYSGATAREWGRKGPPEQFKPIAAQHRVKTVSRLRSAGDVRDAVCNDHGVTIASDWGTSNSVMRVRDGRIVAVRRGSWMHQMCVDGYDGSVPGDVRDGCRTGEHRELAACGRGGVAACHAGLVASRAAGDESGGGLAGELAADETGSDGRSGASASGGRSDRLLADAVHEERLPSGLGVAPLTVMATGNLEPLTKPLWHAICASVLRGSEFPKTRR